MNQYTKLTGILAAAAMLALTGCGRQEGAEEQPEASPEESVIQTEESEAAPEEETDQNETVSAERTEVSAEELYAKGSIIRDFQLSEVTLKAADMKGFQRNYLG